MRNVDQRLLTLLGGHDDRAVRIGVQPVRGLLCKRTIDRTQRCESRRYDKQCLEIIAHAIPLSLGTYPKGDEILQLDR